MSNRLESGTITHLVDTAVLARLNGAVSRDGPTLLERIPSQEDVEVFFAELQSCSQEPLTQRLYLNGEDGTVFVRHVIGNSAVHLCTVAHDYTRVGRDSFSDTWSEARNDSTVRDAVNLLDDMQRLLLRRVPAFLHSVLRSTDGTYTLRTAYRRASHPEPPVSKPRALAWRPHGWVNARHVTPAEATVWAVSHLVSSDSRFDVARLQHIHATLCAVFDSSPSRRVVPNGNSLALLAARLPPAHDPYGRVRYPLLRAVACDHAILTAMSMRPFVLGNEEPTQRMPAFLPLRSKFPIRIIISLIFTLIFFAFALHLTLNPDDTGQNSGGRKLLLWFLWAVFGIGVLETAVICFAHFSRKVISSPVDLLVFSGNQCTRFQVEAACFSHSRAMFNGQWLSFCDEHFHGSQEYPARRFSVSDLLMAGYETSFAMDGREVLITPRGTAMRMLGVNDFGSVLFDMAESSSSQLGTGVVEGVRGAWVSDAEVGGGIRPSTQRLRKTPRSVEKKFLGII